MGFVSSLAQLVLRAPLRAFSELCDRLLRRKDKWNRDAAQEAVNRLAAILPVLDTSRAVAPEVLLAAMQDAHEAAMDRLAEQQQKAVAANHENWQQSDHNFGGQSITGKLIEEIQDMYKRDSAYREKVDAAMKAKGYSQTQIDQAAANSERLVQLQQFAAAGVLTDEQRREMTRLRDDQATRDMQGTQAMTAQKADVKLHVDATATDNGPSAVATIVDLNNSDTQLLGDANAPALMAQDVPKGAGQSLPAGNNQAGITDINSGRSFADSLTPDTVAQTNQPANETVMGQQRQIIMSAAQPVQPSMMSAAL